jgi:hypothetical protein
MTRTQWTLVGVLLVQLVLLLLIAAPWSSGSGSTGPRNLLPELETSSPSRIEIGEGYERLVLSREADSWHVEQAGGYPADGAKVDQLLADLRNLEVRRPVVSGSRYHEALKVSEDQNERRLSLQHAGSSEADVVLFVGSSPNYGVNHVRRGDEDEVYEARGLSPWDLRAESGSWIDTQLLDVRAEDVMSLKLSNPNGEIELARSNGTWVLGGGGDAAAPLDPMKVDSLVRSIGTLRFSEPAGKIDEGQDYGFGAPSATLELVYDIDGQISESFELIVGDEADEEAGTRYSHASGSEYSVVIGKTDADRLLTKTVEELLVGPEDSDVADGD